MELPLHEFLETIDKVNNPELLPEEIKQGIRQIVLSYPALRNCA